MTLEATKEHLVKISDKMHELEHKLVEKKMFYREQLKLLSGIEYDEMMTESLKAYSVLEKAIKFAKDEFAKYQTKHKHLYLKNKTSNGN